MNFALSLFDNKHDAQPRPVTRTWKQLCEHFARPQVRAAKDGPLFSPATFGQPRRLNENVTELSMLVFDCDHNTTIDGLVESLRRLKCAFAVYSTHSHMRVTDSNPTGEPRFRAVIPLAVPVPAESFPVLWRRACLDTGLLADEQAKDLSRMFYTPAKASCAAAYEYHVGDGKFLDWRELDLSKHPSAEKNASVTNSAQRNQPANLTYGYREDRHEELCRRIMARGKLNSRGHYDARCLAHNGKGNKALVYFPDTGVVVCNDGCDYSAILRAEGLPDDRLLSREKARHENEGSESRLPLPELDERALYGLAGDIVRAIEPHSEADRAALLVQTLVAFGNCTGRSAYFMAENDRHGLNLFAVVVGTTSKGRKGTSWGQVERLFRAVDESWTAECVQTGLSSGEGLIWAVRDPIEKQEPIKEKGRVVDYQSVITDKGLDDKRLLVIEPEFASVLRVIERERNTLSAIIRRAWDTGNLRVLTKNSPARATEAHISLIGHITRDELKRNLDETETANGFANRFLWVHSRRSKLLPEGGRLSDSECNPLITRLHEAINHARKTGELRRDERARALWFEVYEDLSAGRGGLLGAVTSRAEAQVMRLACLYAVLDCADVIRVEHLKAALALWRYCEDSARYIFGEATGDRMADAIVAALREGGELGLTRTEINNLFHGHKSAGTIDRSLAMLLEQGRVAPRSEATEGRPVKRYHLVRQTAEKAEKAEKGSDAGAYSAYSASSATSEGSDPVPPADNQPSHLAAGALAQSQPATEVFEL